MTCIGLVSVPMALIGQGAQAGLLEALAEIRRHLLVRHQPLQARGVRERRHVHRAGGNRTETRELVQLLVWALAAGTTASSVAAAARTVNDRSSGRIIRVPPRGAKLLMS